MSEHRNTRIGERESCYDEKEHKIYIKQEDTEHGWEHFVTTVVHMSFHCYQMQEIALYEAISNAKDIDQLKTLRFLNDAKCWSEEKEQFQRRKDTDDLWIEKDALRYSLESFEVDCTRW